MKCSIYIKYINGILDWMYMKLTFLDYKRKGNQPSQFHAAFDRGVVKLGDKSLWGIPPPLFKWVDKTS